MAKRTKRGKPMKHRKPKEKRKESLLNLKVSAADRRALNAAAKKYAKGNLSAWLRLAGVSFRPVKGQLSA